MINSYLFPGFAAALVLGNLLLRLAGKKHVSLAYNLILLLLLFAGAYLLPASTYLGVISANAFSAFFAMLLTSGMLLVHLLAYSRSRDYVDFALIASFALIGMYLVAFANSLITIFLGLELMSIPTVFIILLSRRESLEAATKFFILASVAIALLSFAVVLVYGAANALSLAPAQQNGLLAFALVLFIASLGFEASVFPFNVLLPDVYQGSSAYATSMLGGINKKVGFAALIQVLILIFINSNLAFYIVAALAALTILYGNLVALTQENLKRLFAYSSISQAGYMLIGIAVHSAGGIAATLFQIFAHVFLFLGALAIVAWLESKERNEINDLLGLYRENRFCAISLSVFMLALAGVPLTTGFIGKFLLFLSAVNQGAAWLAIVGIGGSVISIFYYAKAISAMYTNKIGANHLKLDGPTLFVVAACMAIAIVFGVYPQPAIGMVNGAAAYLVQNRTVQTISTNSSAVQAATSSITSAVSSLPTSILTTVSSSLSSTTTLNPVSSSSSISSSSTSSSTTSLNATTTALIGIGIRK